MLVKYPNIHQFEKNTEIEKNIWIFYIIQVFVEFFFSLFIQLDY